MKVAAGGVLALIQVALAGSALTQRLDVTSTADYNHWARTSGTGCPTVQVTLERRDIDGEESRFSHTLTFYGEDGSRSGQIRLDDSSHARHWIRITPDDRAAIVEKRRVVPGCVTAATWEWTRVYSSPGKVLFEADPQTASLTGSSLSLYFEVRPSLAGEAAGDELVLRRADGSEMGRIRDADVNYLSGAKGNRRGLTVLRFGEFRKQVHVIDSTGEVLWHRAYDDLTFFAVAPTDSLVAIAHGDEIELYNRHGRLVRKMVAAVPLRGAVDMVFSPSSRQLVVTTGQYGDVTMYDCSNGNALWTRRVRGRTGIDPLCGVMATFFLRGHVVVATFDQDIFMLTSDDGTLSQHLQLALGQRMFPVREHPGAPREMREVPDNHWRCAVHGRSIVSRLRERYVVHELEADDE